MRGVTPLFAKHMAMPGILVGTKSVPVLVGGTRERSAARNASVRLEKPVP
jgi:hypothetical protein